jgi:hypothetical protein
MPTPENIYQLKISLDDSKPPIWRRFLVPDNFSLADLHEIIQTVMGWDNYHLHMFILNEERYGDPQDDEYDELGIRDEHHYLLGQLGLQEKQKFSYDYDFGDFWNHTLLVEKILPAEEDAYYPACLKGKRACPPEDVGGIWGYMEFVEAMADPKHKEHKSMQEWFGGKFDPEEFDIEETNKLLSFFRPSRKNTPADLDEIEDDIDELMEKEFEALQKWHESLNAEQIETFEQLPLRRDMLAFLNYLHANHPKGTQTTGNLPLKAVREICAQFVKPPVLETIVNGKAYKVRSEEDVAPLLFVHTLAFHALLVTGGQAKQWKLTSQGEAFLDMPVSLQYFYMLATWFFDIDWVTGFPVIGLSDGLPENFREESLIMLKELSIDKETPYETFANQLLKRTNMQWPSQDQTMAPMIMRLAVIRILIQPLEEFGILLCQYTKEDSPDLKSIRLAPLGKLMFELF